MYSICILNVKGKCLYATVNNEEIENFIEFSKELAFESDDIDYIIETLIAEFDCDFPEVYQVNWRY